MRLLLMGFLLLLLGCASEYTLEAFKTMPAAKILQHGETAILKHNYQEAIQSFEALDVLYPFAPETAQSQLDVIYAYYKSSDYESALAAADRYIHVYPRESRTAYAYYMKGVINFERGKSWLQKKYSRNPEQHDLSSLKKAFIDLGDLIKLFPHSSYVQDARLRMIYIRELIAKREIVIAQYYFKRQAYVAAANRASEVVQHFPGSAYTKEALSLMLKSYQALGATQLAHKTQRLLELNF